MGNGMESEVGDGEVRPRHRDTEDFIWPTL